MSTPPPTSQAPRQSTTPQNVTQKYHILIIEDLRGKRSIPLSYATYSLGRDQNNTICIQDPSASRQHLILLRVPLPNRDYIYRIVDGDVNGKPSLNGITINGKPCRQKELAPGDQIHLGEVTKITYHLQSMTEEQYNWYFNRNNTQYQSIQAEAVDPTGTMTTILAH